MAPSSVEYADWFKSQHIDINRKWIDAILINNKNEIEQILGVELDDNFIKNTLIKLQIESEISDKKIKFKSPSWRYDLERPIDLIEEIAKHYGFNNFESTLPIGNNLNSTGDYWDKRIYLSEKLSSTNFYEIQTLSFTDSFSGMSKPREYS